MLWNFSNQVFSKKLPHDIQRVALRKLIMIDNAGCLEDLRVPPANTITSAREHLGEVQGAFSCPGRRRAMQRMPTLFLKMLKQENGIGDKKQRLYMDFAPWVISADEYLLDDDFTISKNKPAALPRAEGLCLVSAVL